jgi:hypothetical protein
MPRLRIVSVGTPYEERPPIPDEVAMLQQHGDSGDLETC